MNDAAVAFNTDRLVTGLEFDDLEMPSTRCCFFMIDFQTPRVIPPSTRIF